MIWRSPSAGCRSVGDLLSRSIQMGVPLRDLLRLAPVLLASASGPEFLQSFPLQAFWFLRLVPVIQDTSERHCSQLYTCCVSEGGTDDWFLPEQWKKWLTVAPEDCLKCYVCAQNNSTMWTFMVTVAEIVPAELKMNRTNGGTWKWFWLYEHQRALLC